MLARIADQSLGWAASCNPEQAVIAFLLLNAALFAASLAAGHLLLWRFKNRRVTLPPGPVERIEVLLATFSVLANTAVSLVGWRLWKAGFLVVRAGSVPLWRIVADALLMLLVMDLLMYGLHRLAHHPLLFLWLHHPHHRYDRPRPLNLFVLSPFEVLAFGALWLVVLCAYPFSFLGIGIYVALNIAWGTIGHLGVEPLPRVFRRAPLVRSLSSSAFHAEHHQDDGVNFGFYLTLWDRLLGTAGPGIEPPAR